MAVKTMATMIAARLKETMMAWMGFTGGPSDQTLKPTPTATKPQPGQSQPQFQRYVALKFWSAADQMRLRQALLNLMSNANKFTEKDTVTIAAHQRSRLVASQFE